MKRRTENTNFIITFDYNIPRHVLLKRNPAKICLLSSPWQSIGSPIDSRGSIGRDSQHCPPSSRLSSRQSKGQLASPNAQRLRTFPVLLSVISLGYRAESLRPFFLLGTSSLLSKLIRLLCSNFSLLSRIS